MILATTINKRSGIQSAALILMAALLSSCADCDCHITDQDIAAQNLNYFQSADLNKDKQLNLKEFISGFRDSEVPQAQTLFTEIDTNQDQFISTEEVQASDKSIF